jgi:hypothetical protein
MHVRRWIGLLCVPWAILSCSKGTAEMARPSASHGTATAARERRNVTTDELDLADLEKEVPAVLFEDPARIVREFKQASPLDLLPSAREAVWFGRSYGISQSGTTGEGFVFLRIKPGPKGQLPGIAKATVLPAVGFASSLEADGYLERGDALRVLDAVMKGKPLPDPSGAVRYMREAEPRDDYAPLVKTGGKSTMIASRTPVYLRQQGERILLIEKWSAGGAGRYAELWKLP